LLLQLLSLCFDRLPALTGTGAAHGIRLPTYWWGAPTSFCNNDQQKFRPVFVCSRRLGTESRGKAAAATTAATATSSQADVNTISRSSSSAFETRTAATQHCARAQCYRYGVRRKNSGSSRHGLCLCLVDERSHDGSESTGANHVGAQLGGRKLVSAILSRQPTSNDAQSPTVEAGLLSTHFSVTN